MFILNRLGVNYGKKLFIVKLKYRNLKIEASYNNKVRMKSL